MSHLCSQSRQVQYVDVTFPHQPLMMKMETVSKMLDCNSVLMQLIGAHQLLAITVHVLCCLAGRRGWCFAVWYQIHKANSHRLSRWINSQWKCKSCVPGNVCALLCVALLILALPSQAVEPPARNEIPVFISSRECLWGGFIFYMRKVNELNLKL